MKVKEKLERKLREIKKVVLGDQKTEAEIQKSIDIFWLKATPEWFKWLSWVLILGVFTFLDKNYKSLITSTATTISYLCLFFYFQSYFFSIKFHERLFVKSSRIRRLISLMLSGALAYFVWLFLYRLVSDALPNFYK
jgi:hypothetical protein